MDEGEAFTEHDVRNASKVCIVGRTIVRELFAGQSPIGKEVRVRNVAFKVVGVLGPKGANMMGQDQDDILLAPWTTIKYRVVATSLSGGNQSATNTSNTTEVNSLSHDLSEHHDEPLSHPVDQRARRRAPAHPVRQRGSDPHQCALGTAEIPFAIQQITDVLRENHHLRPAAPNDFTVRDMTEITKAMSSTTELITKLLCTWP